jgi:hypothetical protein
VIVPADRPTGPSEIERAKAIATVAIDWRPRPYEARWLLGPLLGTFALALALIAVSQMIAFFVWAAGSIATIAIGRWHEAEFERTHPTAALPSATSLPRRDKPHRS